MATEQHQSLVSSVSVAVASSADGWHHAIAHSPAWIHRYLVARSACDSDDEAIRRAKVSVPIVIREAERNPVFAQLRQQAIERTLVLGNEDSTRLARDGYPSVVEYALTRVTAPAVRDRDQLGWAQLIGQTSGALQAQGAVTVDARVQQLLVTMQQAQQQTSISVDKHGDTPAKP